MDKIAAFDFTKGSPISDVEIGVGVEVEDGL